MLSNASRSRSTWWLGPDVSEWNEVEDEGVPAVCLMKLKVPESLFLERSSIRRPIVKELVLNSYDVIAGETSQQVAKKYIYHDINLCFRSRIARTNCRPSP